jgi:GxxExxY protein
MVTEEQEKLSKKVLDCAFEVHSQLGAGLLESVYQTCLQYELQKSGVFVEVEKMLPIIYKDITLNSLYRIDMLIEKDKILIENKSVAALTDIHLAQIMTYMKLSKISLGFLFNFNVPHFKDGIKRVVL